MKTHLVIHHSLTKDSGTVSAQAIRRYHTEELGWRDVGYHALVELVDDRYELLLGRPLLARAAAAYQRNMNRIGVHVCFIGNYDDAPPPIEMLQYAAPHLSDWCELLSIPIDREHVISHHEVAPYKTCPGAKFDITRLIRLMEGA
jgi:hypothetical protein